MLNLAKIHWAFGLFDPSRLTDWGLSCKIRPLLPGKPSKNLEKQGVLNG
jgi:hypothetical protein